MVVTSSKMSRSIRFVCNSIVSRGRVRNDMLVLDMKLVKFLFLYKNVLQIHVECVQRLYNK